MSLETVKNCDLCTFVCTYTLKDIRYNCYFHNSKTTQPPIALWFFRNDTEEGLVAFDHYLANPMTYSDDAPASITFRFALIKGLFTDKQIEKYKL